MKVDNVTKSNIIHFIAGVMQSITFILAFLLWKYYANLTTTQNLTLVAMIITNEALVYVIMRIGNIIAKQK